MPINHPGNTGYAFISYSTKNQADADALKTLLSKKGIRSWMAPGDIPVGSKYAQVINHAIKECACFVLLLTDAAQSSPWVAKEVERAVNHGKTILPIKMENIVLNEEFEFYISTDQIVAVQKIDENSAEFRKVLTTIIAFTGQEPQQEPPQEPRQEDTPTEPTVQVTEPESIPKPQPAAETPASLTRGSREWWRAYWFPLTIRLLIYPCFVGGYGWFFLMDWDDLCMLPVSLTLASISLLWYLSVRIWRRLRLCRLLPLINTQGIDQPERIAAIIGVSPTTVQRDLQHAIRKGILNGVYYDHQSLRLVHTQNPVRLHQKFTEKYLSFVPPFLAITCYALALIFFAFLWTDALEVFGVPAMVAIIYSVYCAAFALVHRAKADLQSVMMTMIISGGIYSVDTLAKKAGITTIKARKSIARLISLGHLKNAYIDEQTQSVVFMTQ